MPINGSPTIEKLNDEEILTPDEEVESESSELMKESILLSIKKMLGLPPEVESFDVDLILLINGSFNILTQLGVGPEKGFAISSNKETWSDFIGDEARLNMVKPYIFLKTKILFDPSSIGGSTLEAYKEQIKEYEWRLNVQVDIEGAFGLSDEDNEDDI